VGLGGPARPATVYVSLPPEGEHANDSRYPVAVVGPGWSGLLVSPSTRIDGLVSVVDIAPTALGRRDGLRSRAHGSAPEELARLDRRIARNGDSRLPATLVVAALVGLFAFLRPRASLLAFALALATNVGLGLLAVSRPAVVVAAMAVAVGAGSLLLERVLRARLALGLALAAAVAALAIALAAAPESVALSPLGPSQSGRFYGLSNLLATLLLVPVLAGVALLRARPLLAAALSATGVALVAANRLGADGGGTLVLLTGLLVLALRLSGRRLTLPAVALLALAAAGLAAALVGIDALTGGSSHVTESLGGGPPGLAGDLADRAELSARRAVSSWGAGVVVAAGLAALAVYGLRRPRFPVSDAVLAAVAVSLVVNDTPTDVAGLGALACACAWHWQRGRYSSAAMRRTAALLLLLLGLVAVTAAGCGGGEETGALAETVGDSLPELESTTETSAAETETETGETETVETETETGETETETGETETGETETDAETETGGGGGGGGDAQAGKAIWNANGCGGCHTLEAAGSMGNVGPNLDESKPDAALTINRVTNGMGAMPAFKGTLSDEDIQNVAAYVVDSTSG